MRRSDTLYQYASQMEYDSLRQRPTGRVRHMVLAVIALLGTCLNIVVNGYSFAHDDVRKALGLGSEAVWQPDNASQVPADNWIRYGALGVIYPWQLLWIAYCVLQLACKVSNTSVPWKVLVISVVASALDVSLVYATAWGHVKQPALPLGISVLLVLTLYSLVAAEAYHLYTLSPDITSRSRWAGWIIVLNGMFAYAAWISIEAMLDMDDVIIHYGHVDAASSSGTVILAMIGFCTLVYFLMESTVLDRFLRGVFVVYPIVIWTVSGIHTMQDQRGLKGRNYDLSLALLVGVCGLFVIRIMLQVVFSMFRPLPRYKPDYVLK